MGSGRILGVGRLEGVWLRLPPQLSSRPPGPNLHFGVPAVTVEGHLLKEGLPTAVRGVHLGGRTRGTGQALAATSFPSSPAPGQALACFRMFSMRLIRRGLVFAWNLSSPVERDKGCQALGWAPRPACTQQVPPIPTHPALHCPSSRRPRL